MGRRRRDPWLGLLNGSMWHEGLSDQPLEGVRREHYPLDCRPHYIENERISRS